ncbi:MAG: type I methionyl aminopeptidase [Patescibacteria group bacterium]
MSVFLICLMSNIKTAEEIEVLREAGRRLARVMEELRKAVRPGISTFELDALGEKLIRDGGDTPAFKNYKPQGARIAFPATVCISINNEAVHGIPKKERTLETGDIVSLDAGLIHQGLISDMCITVPVGAIDATAHTLIETTREALMAGIAAARGGAQTGDIGAAIEKVISGSGFAIVKELGGHGVGHNVHEEPHIAHFGKQGTGKMLLPGMVITIEPTISEGTGEVLLGKDRFTYETVDGARTAQFEHTIVITDGEPEILTVV